MANTYTDNLKLAKPAAGDRTWNVPVNGNADALDALSPASAFAVTTTEVPSASLNVAVAPGTYQAQDGTLVDYAGSTSIAIPALSTRYLYLDLTASGVLVVGTAWPTRAHIRLAIVATTSTTISSITDARVAFVALGTYADGANLTFGTSAGTKIGTAANQKLAFFGNTPVVQPTLGARSAGAAYTSYEQAMLQTVYDAFRSLGLGS